MDSEIEELRQLWKKKGSDLIENYRPYPALNELHRIASLFAAGRFYYYILNFYNLEIEYVHHTVPDVLGYKPEQLSVNFILQNMPEEDIESINRKENLAIKFLTETIKPEEIPFYKVAYFIRLKDANGELRNILHQATALTISESGAIEHAINIHTDVTHLGITHHDAVSFISLNEKLKSYFNVGLEKESPVHPSFAEILSDREIDIVRKIANGLKNKAIADKLNISTHTVRTHRKNIFAKTKCNNAAQLISQCMMQGVI